MLLVHDCFKPLVLCARLEVGHLESAPLAVINQKGEVSSLGSLVLEYVVRELVACNPLVSSEHDGDTQDLEAGSHASEALWRL